MNNCAQFALNNNFWRAIQGSSMPDTSSANRANGLPLKNQNGQVNEFSEAFVMSNTKSYSFW